MLKITQFTFGLQPGGQERVVVDLAKTFHEMGHICTVYTTQFRGELTVELESSDIAFHCLGLKKSYDPRALVPLMKYLKNNAVDVVITHGNSGCLIPRIAAIVSNVPAFIHVEHSIASNYKRKYNIFIDKFLSNFADKIVCVSMAVKQSLLQIEKIKPEKIVVIPNGLDIKRFAHVTDNTLKKSHFKKIGVIGRFSKEKGHIYFVEAATKIVKTFKNVEFIFVGDGPCRQWIEQKVKEYNIDTYCHFLGVRHDIGNILQELDIFVLPSIREGLPISLLEAQYFGIPSVATDVGGNPEIIKNGYNGLIVPPKNSNAIASAIHRLLIDDELRNTFSLRGKEMFNQTFTVHKMANAYLEIINSILSQKK